MKSEVSFDKLLNETREVFEDMGEFERFKCMRTALSNKRFEFFKSICDPDWDVPMSGYGDYYPVALLWHMIDKHAPGVDMDIVKFIFDNYGAKVEPKNTVEEDGDDTLFGDILYHCSAEIIKFVVEQKIALECGDDTSPYWNAMRNPHRDQMIDIFEILYSHNIYPSLDDDNDVCYVMGEESDEAVWIVEHMEDDESDDSDESNALAEFIDN